MRRAGSLTRRLPLGPNIAPVDDCREIGSVEAELSEVQKAGNQCYQVSQRRLRLHILSFAIVRDGQYPQDIVRCVQQQMNGGDGEPPAHCGSSTSRRRAGNFVADAFVSGFRMVDIDGDVIYA